jgi:hypothetical protein
MRTKRIVMPPVVCAAERRPPPSVPRKAESEEGSLWLGVDVWAVMTAPSCRNVRAPIERRRTIHTDGAPGQRIGSPVEKHELAEEGSVTTVRIMRTYAS